MAKVMISIPDLLLKRVDAMPAPTGRLVAACCSAWPSVRSRRGEDRRHEEFERLMDSLEIDLGGQTAADLIREDRESH